MDNQLSFLSDILPRPWSLDAKHGFEAAGLFIGKGANAIEVAVAHSTAAPARAGLLESWKVRRAGRASPVLLVVLYPTGASLCGASGEEPPVYPKVDTGQIERLCREVLDQPDRHAALRFLAQALPSLETALPGLNNEGLVALHELQHGAPGRPDWSEAGRKAAATLGKREGDLLAALGFQVERLDNLTSLLRGGDRRAALAVMLHEDESPEAGTTRFNSLSPVSYALTKADSENLPWVVLVQGNRLRLYSTAVDAGVGRRGRTETYIECQPSLLSDEHLAYIWLLYSAEALAAEGSLSQILNSSERFSGDLAERLRERIYDLVVPQLARGIVASRNIKKPTPEDLEQTYEMALTVLFRLLFVAYAEDRDLLPYRSNEAYRRRSLKQKAQELVDSIMADTPIADGSSHWQEVALVWQAVAVGNREWGVPAYDGGLFTSDATVSTSGAQLANIVLPNEVFEAALRSLLVIETPEGVPGPVDFRSLGVREFGTIYEGLLESELSLAEVDLVLRRQQNNLVYVPAGEADDPVVLAGETYLHNRSGGRKSSGSYYTKHFAVEHLLDGALEPALADHFARVTRLDDVDAAEAFFDFRVADIAMGSGHFLVAAIDRIEKGMADFLANRDLPGVRKELAALRDAAVRELGELAEAATIEDGQLLRRLIARRCIYGVDLNALSVQLARLAVWIHTFVPGLPLSVLDHTLVRGNSLVGVGTVDEIRRKFQEATGTLFAVDAESLLGQAAKPLNRLANINDATLQDIATARDAIREASEAISGTAALCDLIAAGPISTDEKVVGFPFEDWERLADDLETHAAVGAARRDLAGLHALHFPIAFPEVFLRDRPGFDVILGNPPWEKVKVEEHGFWGRHFPGLRGLPQREFERQRENLRHERPDLVAAFEEEVKAVEGIRKALVGGSYPGMGTGDPDLYKAFCWRFWYLTAPDVGRIGVVLPRSALAAKGSTDFRLTMFRESASVDVTMLVNNRRWVFPEVHPQYSIGLVAIARGTPEGKSIGLRGPYASLAAFSEGIEHLAAKFDREQVLVWNDTAALPLLKNDESAEVFVKLTEAPRIAQNDETCWLVKPARNETETSDREFFDFNSDECPVGFWPVLKGESFEIWNLREDRTYAYANPDDVLPWLQRKRLRSFGRSTPGAYKDFPQEYVNRIETLPCLHPRIAFRDVARSTDSRTLIACLLPPNVFVTEKAPFLVWPRGDEKDAAFFLGVLCSIPFDWYVRTFVETKVAFFLFNAFPVPRPERDHAGWLRVISLAGRLACPDDRFAAWAEAVGVECGPLAADEKEDMIHELDAVVAHLYGLSEPQLVHIFETFHVGWDYQNRLDAVLQHYNAWIGRG